MKKNIEEQNAEFWNELCGSGFARHLGITDHSEESLKIFDKAYFDLYPYLLTHVPPHEMRGKKVLDIGLGYGTLGQEIARLGAVYQGLDIAEGPVNMMKHRLRMHSLDGDAVKGSMLACPFDDESQDCVVSIGCFHHTGDVQRCFDETFRVLKPGGYAYLMVYNQYSYRQWLRWPLRTFKSLFAEDTVNSGDINVSQRKAYDTDSSGNGAPETVFLSVGQLNKMLSKFSSVKVTKENTDHITLRGRTLIPRSILLTTLGRWLGLDLYIRVRK
jgi:2-polyprenyl-3-methyl-5-hydroxy-6-metoxy-1,4-benzoquinol methylase